ERVAVPKRRGLGQRARGAAGAPAAMNPRAWIRKAQTAGTVPVLAVVLGLVAGAAVMVISNAFSTGRTDLGLPVRAYSSLLAGSVTGLDELVRTVSEATPLILAGLSVGIGLKDRPFYNGANREFLLGGTGARRA